MQTTVFYLERFLKKLADDQCSSIYTYNLYHRSGLTRNLTFIGSIYFYIIIFADTVFLLRYGRIIGSFDNSLQLSDKIRQNTDQFLQLLMRFLQWHQKSPHSMLISLRSLWSWLTYRKDRVELQHPLWLPVSICCWQNIFPWSQPHHIHLRKKCYPCLFTHLRTGPLKAYCSLKILTL